MALFLDRNLKVAYDAEVLSGAFPAPLQIRRGKPDDKSMTLIVPRIMVSTISGTEANRAYEIGSDILYRHLNFVFYCFPATASGEPDIEAADLLKSYMRDTFGTQYIKIVDYMNPACTPTNILFCQDVAEVTRVQDPVDRKNTTNIAEEVHRFDMHVSIRYAVLETHAS
jgi:hypothetical protein